jgi:hypothetical protein
MPGASCIEGPHHSSIVRVCLAVSKVIGVVLLTGVLVLVPAGQIFPSPLPQNSPGTTGYSIGAWINITSTSGGRSDESEGS